jgi:trk system potassium uptake protein TrkH
MKEFWIGFKTFLQNIHPIRLVTLGYLSYIVTGWILLSLPFTHSGKVVINNLDSLFTVTSAISTTGLVTLSTGNDFNFLGQIIILILIQIGGLGYMTFGSFVVLARSKVLSNRRKLISETVFTLPQGLQIDKFIKSICVFTLVIEGIGMIFLLIAFIRLGIPDPLWSAIFHSVSAFCTAGFSLYDSSFIALRSDFWVNFILSSLSYMGAIGFIVVVDIWRTITNKTESITLTTRVILTTTAWITGIGFFLIFIGEPSIRILPLSERIIVSFFQVMTSITTVGFNTIETGLLSKASLLLIMMLMIIGASPSGTGGGLKTTTFSVIFGVIKSTVKGRNNVKFWGSVIPEERIWVAMASLGFYLAVLIVGSYLLSLTESHNFEQIIFEAASALGTVGLSTGITSSLSNIGKLIVVFLMFLGRLGPLAFGISLFLPSMKTARSEHDDIAV